MALSTPPAPVLSARPTVDVAVHVGTLAPVHEPFLKRPFDIALAAVMLVVSAPVWAAIAIAIKLEDHGPVFYRQHRWGRDQTHFEVLKFRSMVVAADLRQATEHDNRVTRVGRTLRATGLDELPQLINILRGEMSFVGPRALATQERDQTGVPIRYEDTPGFARRLQVRPGLTGLATVFLPKDASSRLKFRTDLLYVSRTSFWLDLRLVVLSFWISFRGKWETRARKV